VSIESMSQVLHHSRAKGTAKLVLVGIANHEGDGGAYPTVRTLARYAGCDPRNVRKHLAKLVALGEVSIQYQAGGDLDCPDDLRPNRYHVQVSCPAWCDRSPHHRDTRDLAGPQVGMDLWIDPLTKTSGGGGTPGRKRQGDPLTKTPPKPSLSQPAPLHVVPDVLDTRACLDCGRPERACQAAQAKWPHDDRHPYRPTVRHAQG